MIGEEERTIVLRLPHRRRLGALRWSGGDDSLRFFDLAEMDKAPVLVDAIDVPIA